jgi:hypothetical protein
MTITALTAAHALQTCLVATVGATLIFKILPMFRLDCFRQSMFTVRDELFDYAAAGNIDFADPAYILLRRQMNGMIRYGHQLTLFRALATTAMKKVAGGQRTLAWRLSWVAALDEIKSEEVRLQMCKFHEESMGIAAKHIIAGSLVLWLALAFVAMSLLMRGAAHGAHQLLKVASKRVLSGPLDHRFIEEDAVGAMA